MQKLPLYAVILALGTGVFYSAPALAQNSEQPAETEITAQEIDADADFSAFDFYVGGNFYGTVFGSFKDDWFQAETADSMIELLPAVRDPQAFRSIFSGRIAKNRMQKGVGAITADTLNFRIDVEIDPEQSFLRIVEDLGDLRGTDTDLSLLNTFSLTGSTTTDNLNLTDNISLSHDTTIGKGSFAIQSIGSLNSSDGYNVQSAFARQDVALFGQDMRASTGLLETAGNMRFARTLEYIGMRLESNQDIAYRDEQLQGSNIELFLPRRSQVEIYRDSADSGRVIYSRLLDFGTVQIDTRNFPIGSYNIEIVTRDGSGVVTRERRPFTKTQRLAPHGKPLASFELGNVHDNLDFQDVTVAQGSYRQRLTDNIDAGIAFAATTDDSVIELSIGAQREMRLFEPAGLLELSLTGAFTADSKPVGMEAALTWTGDTRTASLIASKIYDRDDLGVLNQASDLRLNDRNSLSFNVSSPIKIGKYVVSSSFGGEFTDDKAMGSRYRYGPVFAYRPKAIHGYQPELKLEYSVTDSEERALATMTVRNDVSKWTKIAEMSARFSQSEKMTAARAGFGYNGGMSDADDWRRNLRADLALRADPLTSNNMDNMTFVDASADYKAEGARFLGYASQNLREATGRIGGEAQTSLIWSEGAGMRLTSGTVSSDMALAMIKLEGSERKKINIAVNGNTREIAYPGDTIVIPLPVYKKSVITAFPSGGDGSFKIREREHIVVGYPGNIATRSFSVQKLYFLMGMLGDVAGIPLPNQRFIFQDKVYYADEGGFFNLETTIEPGKTYTIDAQGKTCTFTAPPIEDDSLVIDIGNVACGT